MNANVRMCERANVLPLSFQTYLDTISKRGIRRGLDRMQEALRILDEPQKRYQVIHIAGTNGKGSTCQFIAQILARSGHRVGLTLSPHVDDYRERIQISNDDTRRVDLISQTDLLSTHEGLISVLSPELELTYFEWSTLLAFEYFRQRQVKFVVLETGMGGRWDATNVCDSIVSSITTIGYDHMDYLGDTLGKILNEKLQIIKPGSDFLFGPQEPALIAQAKAHCKQVGASFIPISPISPMNYLQSNWAFATQLASLLQKRGAFIAEEALIYGPHISNPPARLEIISNQPEILVDGAHNEQGLKALADHVQVQYPDGYNLIFGCLSDRPFLKLAALIRSSHENYWLRFDAGDRTTPETTYKSIRETLGGHDVSLNDTLRHVISNSRKPFVVCGSLYLCSQFKQWYKKGKII